jgi:hypothetical protein
MRAPNNFHTHYVPYLILKKNVHGVNNEKVVNLALSIINAACQMSSILDLIESAVIYKDSLSTLVRNNCIPHTEQDRAKRLFDYLRPLVQLKH